MRLALVFDDWRSLLDYGSIYATELGLRLSSGDLHSGTTWHVEANLPEDLAAELRAAYVEHGAYAVFRVVPESLSQDELKGWRRDWQ